MSFPVISLFIVALISFGGLFVWSSRVIDKDLRGRLKIYECFVAKYCGELRSGGLLSSPFVLAELGGRVCKFKICLYDDVTFLELSTKTSFPKRIKAEVYPKCTVAKSLLKVGMPSILSGNPKFDDIFFVMGNSRKLVEEQVLPAVEESLIQHFDSRLSAKLSDGSLKFRWQVDRGFCSSSFDMNEQLISKFVEQTTILFENVPQDES